MPVFLSQRTVGSFTILEMGEQFQFQRQGDLWSHCNFTYSALASFRMGMSGNACAAQDLGNADPNADRPF